MHGVREIIKKLHAHYEIMCYQRTQPHAVAVSDMGFTVDEIPYQKPLRMLRDALLYKVGITPRDNKRAAFLAHIKSADIVANLYGIYFCDHFAKSEPTRMRALRRTIGFFLISLIAKLYGKKTVKCPASYGPISSRGEALAARFAAGYIFDVICAREHESARQLGAVAGVTKKITVSPDMANLMLPDPAAKAVDQLIGLSVSYQIINQWKSEEPYIACLANLINHITSTTGYSVRLIPNELHPGSKQDDAYVAEQIKNACSQKDKVSILDAASMNSTQIKTAITRCEILIASRYHSCVAALSAGVPLLVIGWHYKYDELMELYEQGRWIISSAHCSSAALIQKFDELWQNRQNEKNKIVSRCDMVQQQVLAAGRLMFMK